MLEPTIRVIMADDHILLREGFKNMLLPHQSDITLIAEASNGVELVQKVDQYETDIVIVDFNMPKMNGAEACQNIKANYPNIGIISFTMLEEENYLQSMKQSGATGYLLKTSSRSEIVEAIKTVFKGYTYYCPSILDKYYKLFSSNKKTWLEFSYFERRIIEMICCQLTTKEIAFGLKLSVRTVDDYRHKIQEKTGAKNAVGIAIYAMKTKLVEIEDLESNLQDA